MSAPLKSFFRGLKEMRRFNALSPDARRIVFYAEDAASWVHFEPIVKELIGPCGQQICYLTSSLDDPVLNLSDKRILSFYIGSGVARTTLFQILRANVMVMTMPDLETLHIKRSKYPVHYVYVHHSMVSVHMAYRPEAFDHFDAILCVGRYHEEEIRENEKRHGLKPKTLVKHGYGRLDSILESVKKQSHPLPPLRETGKRVLVAPTWGNHALLETCGGELAEILLEAGHRVTVRPHPRTVQKHPQVIRELERRFGRDSRFVLETDVSSQESLHNSHLMISDYSGAALEYAFGLERPVLFIDVPPKVNNPEYRQLSREPIELGIRGHIGAVVSPERLAEVSSKVDELCADPQAFKERIRKIRSEKIYNIGNSGAAGAAYIARTASAHGTSEKLALESFSSTNPPNRV